MVSVKIDHTRAGEAVLLVEQVPKVDFDFVWDLCRSDQYRDIDKYPNKTYV